MKTALVLSGGGARGAYEVGVLSYLREELPQRLGRTPRLDILCGTSVGAINAAFVAATADDPATQGRKLADHWRSLRMAEVFDLSLADVMRAGRLLLGGDPPAARPGELRRGGLLNTSGLERFVARRLPWRKISANLAAGHLDALSVSTTHVASGNTVVFVERRGGGLPPWSRDPFIHPRAVEVNPLHVLASAAIPVLFPAVSVEGAFYCDGGLRQNTPLAPAVRLGADRALVISLRHMPSQREAQVIGAEAEAAYPSPWFIFGKALNALMLDHTEYDMDRLHRVNALIDGGVRAFGDRFLGELNAALEPLRGQPLRRVMPFLIRPSVDIGKIAARHAQRADLAKLPGLLGRSLRYLARASVKDEADLLSYLLFDGEYASELIELGRRDAAARAAELVEFFAVTPALQAVV